MASKPVSYFQTDPRWRYISYSAKGENTTIGASGCGPTSMSMVLATWADASVTPKTECAWALAHGYKAPHQGTYYGYFVPAAKRYGLTCYRVNTTNIYGNSTSSAHAAAKSAIDNGCLVIACMGKGNWTRSGHYIVVYNIVGNTIYINDPASTKPARTAGSYDLFKHQVKYYWVIEPPKKNNVPSTTYTKEDDYMTGEAIYMELTKYLNTQPVPGWAKAELEQAKTMGITDGENAMQLIPRYQAAIMAKRAVEKNK